MISDAYKKQPEAELCCRAALPCLAVGPDVAKQLLSVLNPCILLARILIDQLFYLSDAYKKPAQPEAELAALLHGLHYRGLAVGPDDAAKVAAVFRSATDWSRQRRIRVLKSLLARNERGAASVI